MIDRRQEYFADGTLALVYKFSPVLLLLVRRAIVFHPLPSVG